MEVFLCWSASSRSRPDDLMSRGSDVVLVPVVLICNRHMLQDLAEQDGSEVGTSFDSTFSFCSLHQVSTQVIILFPFEASSQIDVSDFFFECSSSEVTDSNFGPLRFSLLSFRSVSVSFHFTCVKI